MKSKILGWSHTERANYWPASHWSPIIGPHRVPARCRPRFRERPKHSKSDVSMFLKLLWAYVEDALHPELKAVERLEPLCGVGRSCTVAQPLAHS